MVADFRMADPKHRLQIAPTAWPPPPDVPMKADGRRPTVRTHFNPAFWTALWNLDYFNGDRRRPARKQKVEVLDVRSGKMYRAPTETVHAEDGLGLALIEAEDMVNRAEASLPDGEERDRVVSELREFGDIQLDIENLYEVMEQSDAYQETLRAIREGRVTSLVQKTNIAIFVASRRYRHPVTLAMMLREAEAKQLKRWEALLEIKKLFECSDWLKAQIWPLVISRWTLHVAPKHAFPLPDYAALMNGSRSRVWAALSPRMLLEIALDMPSSGIGTIREFDPVRDEAILKNYRRLAIEQATTQIIFSDRPTLAEWRETFDFRQRLRELQRTCAALP